MKLLRTSNKEKLLKQKEEKDILHERNKEIVITHFTPNTKTKHESQKTME